MYYLSYYHQLYVRSYVLTSVYDIVLLTEFKFCFNSDRLAILSPGTLEYPTWETDIFSISLLYISLFFPYYSRTVISSLFSVC